MRIAITGSAGFIGAATVRAAEAAGHQVIHFDRSDGPNILDPDTWPAAFHKIDHLIHLAGVLGTAELFDDPHHAVDVNVHGALNMLQHCHRIGAGYTAITMPPVFNSVYTATKVCADRLTTAWYESMGLRTSKVVAFNAYGPGQKHGPGHPQKIIPTFATEAWAGRPIPVWGDGEQTVDLVHADDLGHLLVEATAFEDDEVFDGGTGYPLTVNRVAEYVNGVTGNTAGIKYLPMRKGETPTHIVAEGRGWDLLDEECIPQMNWKRLHETIEAYRPADHGGAGVS